LESGRSPSATGPLVALRRPLVALRRPLDAIDPTTWDRLASANPSSTPFSRWAFHRAWWDGYGASAHDETLVLVDPEAAARDPEHAEPLAIAPLMHRHEVEPTDDDTRTQIRHGRPLELTAVAPSAKAIFMGASYHADYQTLLAPPELLTAAADGVADYLARPDQPTPWDVVDLRRLRCGDPAAEALGRAFAKREMPCAWTLNVEREDVCPVTRLGPDVRSIDDFLATLSKKERHEVRRKVRRSEAAGETRLVDSSDPVGDLDAFVDLHQKRWGAQGLFPDNQGGAAGRVFFRRLFELFGPDTLRLAFLEVGARRVSAAVWFQDAERAYYFNAGVDPEAKALSPGVVMVERLFRRLIEDGRRELDFLRGDEGYKYEWGARDEPIQRVLVRRTEGA
jgi:hypothetical protein